jgi:hypothetical protein
VLTGVSNQSAPSGHPNLGSIIGSLTIIFSEVTPTFPNGDQEYCLLFEEHNLVWKNPQQMLVSCMFRGPAMLQDLLRSHLCHWLHSEVGGTYFLEQAGNRL